ncbi:MAG: helix-turn-helix transcriptional regulator [Solirubrobacterales bacterium]
MAPRKLTTASYLVLGMVEMIQPVTPYELKAFAAQSVVNFWSLPHTQIYTQCDRLLEDGYLSEKRETSGRRRRSFSITREGAKALEAWREEPADAPIELRDLSLLKLFFGADPKVLAEAQLASHEAKLEEYLAVRRSGVPSEGVGRSLEAGISHEREFVRFWKSQLKA